MLWSIQDYPDGAKDPETGRVGSVGGGMHLTVVSPRFGRRPSLEHRARVEVELEGEEKKEGLKQDDLSLFQKLRAMGVSKGLYGAGGRCV
ncbi:hypothetical protein SKAU_G00031070 [Synaphobranchus kaupii]|uniref:Uncharacterized protein n=1 Tax=Synaphobranchus kaupii TaxID=118154 RepID=A0A9Q1GF29_SYNKA|nr:hypothetical protein SKAU_G00031070 [Synaphobranchus kaupii]